MTFLFFPLDPVVWGTVSDYISIIVYSITAFLIWKTFRSQIEVQRVQQRQIDIENYNYRLKIRPIFDLQEASHLDKCTEGLIHFENINLILILNENIAKDIIIEVNKTDTPSLLRIDMFPPAFLNVGENITISMEIRHQIKINITNRIDVIFQVKYKDLEGNNYKQKCTCIIRRSSIATRSSSPIILTNNNEF